MDPKIIGAFGVLSMCCICSSIVSGVMMGGDEEKDDPSVGPSAGPSAEAVAADPNSTPEEVAAAKAVADKAATDKAAADKVAADKAAKDLADAARVEAERVRIANMTVGQRGDLRWPAPGAYKNFAECWADAEGDWGANGRFNCCESRGVPYPNPSDGEGYLFCLDNT